MKKTYEFYSNGKLIYKETFNYFTENELFIRFLDLQKKLQKKYPKQLITARIAKD